MLPGAANVPLDINGTVAVPLQDDEASTPHHRYSLCLTEVVEKDSAWPGCQYGCGVVVNIGNEWERQQVRYTVHRTVFLKGLYRSSSFCGTHQFVNKWLPGKLWP